MKSQRRWIALAVLLLAAGQPLAEAARKSDPDKLPPVQIQDLHYGDVLFHFWADEDSGLQALTRLEAYSQWGRMPHHAADAQLLAAGLYLQLGMHNEAGRRFETLLGEQFSIGVRNKAWFYLAKIWYDRGYYDRTQVALAHIQGVLPADLEGERTLLLVNSLMHQQHYDEAIAKLTQWQGPADWMAYARFNLGVALVRSKRLADADPILSAVGTLDTSSSELLDLRDKANLALGFAYLQADDPAKALPPLERVRLDGPFSTRALLGAGWARAAQGQYRAALAPWLELHRRSLLDAAVQESFLAVPYAYSQLNAAAQSAQYYEDALKSFASESQSLQAAIDNINSGHMLDGLVGTQQDQQFGWFWQLKQLPDSPLSRYLYTILADNDFQEGLKNYRDLGYLQRSLARWDDSMDAFDAMIDTRQRAYAQQLPRTDALLASDAPSRLRAARAAIDSRLNAIETVDDVAALGTPEERAQWAQINQIEERVGNLPAGPDRDAIAAKLKLIKGALYWRLDADFKQRAYNEHRSLKELDAALQELQNRWVRVQRARATVPTNSGEFADRILALSDRIKAIRDRLASTSQQQSQYLATLAVGELHSQQERLDAYSIEARFHLADIYDRANDQSDKTAAPAPSTQPDQPAAAPAAPEPATPAAPPP